MCKLASRIGLAEALHVPPEYGTQRVIQEGRVNDYLLLGWRQLIPQRPINVLSIHICRHGHDWPGNMQQQPYCPQSPYLQAPQWEYCPMCMPHTMLSVCHCLCCCA